METVVLPLRCRSFPALYPVSSGGSPSVNGSLGKFRFYTHQGTLYFEHLADCSILIAPRKGIEGQYEPACLTAARSNGCSLEATSLSSLYTTADGRTFSPMDSFSPFPSWLNLVKNVPLAAHSEMRRVRSDKKEKKVARENMAM